MRARRRLSTNKFFRGGGHNQFLRQKPLSELYNSYQQSEHRCAACYMQLPAHRKSNSFFIAMKSFDRIW